MVDHHVFLELAGADAHKSNAIPVAGIHIGLQLKDKACELRILWRNQPSRTFVGHWRQGVLQKRIEKQLHPKIGHGAAEKDRSLFPSMNLFEIQTGHKAIQDLQFFLKSVVEIFFD
jgi:hypothetical protein